MPSNADNIKAIEEISEQLGKDAPDTEGKTNAELANILSVLKAEKKEADKDLTPDAAAKAAAEAKALAKAEREANAEAEKPDHSVGKRKAITTLRGILSDGDAIVADDLPGGKKAFDAFLKSGHIVKN